MKIIIEAAKKKIGKKKVKQPSKPWYTEEIRQLVKRRNRLMKNIGINENREEWLKTCQDINKKVKEEKKRIWIEYVNNMDMRTEEKKVWNTIRSMENTRQKQNNNEILIDGDKSYITDKEKAKTYKSISKIEKTKEDRIIKKEYIEYLKRPNVEEECEKNFRMAELEEAIHNTKEGKPPGGDEITNEMLKNMGKSRRK